MLTFVTAAYAYVTTDLNNWNLSESLEHVGAGGRSSTSLRGRRLGLLPLARYAEQGRR